MPATALPARDRIAGMSSGNGPDGGTGARNPWWLDPALAELAFGHSTHASRTWRPPTDSDSPFADMRDRRLRIDLDDPLQREFGDYELLEVVGEGGMGVVYRARQRNLNREVAIKLLSAGAAASDEIIETLRSEAQNAAQLQHPNIVVVHELGEYGGLIFYAMQLVRGPSLSHVLEARHALPPDEAAALIKRIAEGVHYAHRLGVLHLDLKPGNILLGEDGEPRIADFGLARRLEQALAVANERVAGTPSYMAPEQAQVQGPALSAATDVYGLGAVLYELLTGAPPFLADDPHATLRQVLGGPLPPPRQRNPAIPRDLEAIVLRSLAREPDQRYPGAGALAEDLGNFLAGRPVQARPLNPLQRTARFARREPRLAATLTLALLALLVGVIATTLQWRRAESNATTANARLWESRRMAALRQEMDGASFAALPGLTSNIQEQEDAGRDDLAALERRRVGMLLARAPVLIDAMQLGEGASLLTAELSPDGRMLAAGFNDLSVRWYATGDLRELGRVDLTGLPTSDGQLHLPMLLRFVDDRRLRVTLDWISYYVIPPGSDSHLVDLERGVLVEPPPQFAALSDITYSADGDYALLRNRDSQMQLWQVAPWKPLSRLVATTPGGLPWLLGPGARYAASVIPATHELQLFDPHDLSRPRRIPLPGGSTLSAWAESRDGRWLALGDFNGRILRLDTRTHDVRQMSSPLGRQTLWLAFSEDDAWLAAVSLLGVANVFDVQTGDSLSSNEMRTEFTLTRVAISHRRRVLMASGDGQASLWRIPAPGPQTRDSKRMGAMPGTTLAGFFGTSLSAASGLLANTGIDGEVSLWRLPASPRLEAHAAPWRPEVQHYDGRRVVDVAWNRLRLLSTTRAPSSRWITLPQPPVFAELVGPGRDLVVVLGHMLHVYDADTLQLRYPPRPLPETPIKFAASDDGASLVLGFTEGGAAGIGERLENWDLRRGVRRSQAVLPGPLRMLQFSRDGSRLVVVSTLQATASVLARDTLTLLATYQADPGTPPIWASFGADADHVYLAVRSGDPRLENDAILVWDIVGKRLQERRATYRAMPIGVIDARGKPFVAGRNLNLLDPDRADTRQVPRLSPRIEPLARMVASHDGRLVAQAFRSEVQLYDANSGDPVGSPLFADSNGIDVLSQIAFSPDDRQLLARSAQGYLWRFPIAAETRSVAAIRQQSWRLNPRGKARPALVQAPLDDGEHARLRKHDTGRWSPALEPRPQFPVERTIGGNAIARAAPGSSPLQLDLAPACNIAPDTVLDIVSGVFAEMISNTATGLVRADGIDYDVRCTILLQGLGDPARGADLTTARGIAVPAVPVAAFHVLLQATQAAPDMDTPTLANLRVHYRDGSSALLPLRIGREVGNRGRGAQAAWVLHDPVHLFGVDRPIVTNAPRLPNPHPERLVASIDLETVRERWSSPAFFAVTVEPVRSPGNTPVIAAADSRTTR
jgi:WD40 repeat protein